MTIQDPKTVGMDPNHHHPKPRPSTPQDSFDSRLFQYQNEIVCSIITFLTSKLFPLTFTDQCFICCISPLLEENFLNFNYRKSALHGNLFVALFRRMMHCIHPMILTSSIQSPCLCKHYQGDQSPWLPTWIMTGGTPEVRSDKSLTLMKFDICHLTFKHLNI